MHPGRVVGGPDGGAHRRPDLRVSDAVPVPLFQGTFHGNGHTISGLSFEGKGSKSGLFRTLTQSAVVEDLTVEGTVSPQGSGGQAGLLAGENDGTSAAAPSGARYPHRRMWAAWRV